MNESFELLSTMSPKVDKTHMCIRQPPTKLALRKYFRKSLNAPHLRRSIKHDSIIVVDSSSSCSSEEDNVSNESPIVISDSESSFTVEKTPDKTAPERGGNKKEDNLTPGQSYKRLSREKYDKIELWVEDVNKAKHNVSGYSEVSSVMGDDNPGFKKPETSVAASSTMLERDLRFDELFKRKKKSSLCFNDKEKETCDDRNDLVVNDSMISESLENSFKSIDGKSGTKSSDKNNLITDESFQNDFKNMTLDDSLQLNESLSSRLRKKNCGIGSSKNNLQSDTKKKTKVDSSQLSQNERINQNESLSTESPADKSLSGCQEYENLLDSLYGNSWREKKEDILPSSEPKLKKPKSKITKTVPKTERRENKISNLLDEGKKSNLLQDLQRARFRRALESPWMQTIKKICDSDTESEEENKMPHVKLTFEDDSSESSSESDSDVPKKAPTKKTQLLKEKNENVGTYSFLASLSGSVPNTKCDMTALIFRNNFKQQRDKLTEKLFHLYNEKVFDKSLPEDTKIEWSDRMRGTAGCCRCRKITRRTGAIERHATIVLSSKVLDTADRLRDTLIHEMCHAATWIVNQVTDGHGPFWKSWACRAMKTFPELPPIKRCHEYVINTKYTYKCTGCGYSIGRHTKSLNTEKKRCGYCYGTFEVLINKISKKGETKSVPATPKKPSGFALFVKENYANVKTPDLKHGDVMKILGQKFADLKVN
ncbi:acidic repeat-containing protein-like [Tribolium madens]|uniref:acidic repeat-containing protein-like n=1 Tax=Tribolium madens TaxID=41895 RepID=UPI001CF73840|nr:acidic repeat-containing protein-like [Tribolium madens]